MAVLAVQTEADLLRLAGQLDDVEPGAVAVHREDVAAVVDLQVIGHVAVGIGEGIALRNIEADFDRALRLTDVPGAHAAREVSEERQPAVERIAEVLLARVHSVARATLAVVAARILLAGTRVDP